jgi:hypothetical protein
MIPNIMQKGGEGRYPPISALRSGMESHSPKIA